MAFTDENKEEIMREAQRARDYITSEILNRYWDNPATPERQSGLTDKLRGAISRLEDVLGKVRR